MKRFFGFVSACFLMMPLTVSAVETEGPVAPAVAESSLPLAAPSPWRLEASVALPFRGFGVQAGTDDETAQDPRRQVSYMAPANLEGTVQIGYRGLGVRFDRTLAAAKLGEGERVSSSRSVNEAWHFDLMWENSLYEIRTQRVKGMQTDLSLDGTSSLMVARPDLEYRSFGGRVISGLPFGADTVNSLGNFYATGVAPNSGLSVDLLFSAEVSQQSIAASSPFIPVERQAVFGRGSTLSKLEASGLGLGVGGGLTVPMDARSYFSMAALLGGNYNLTKAEDENGREDVSGWGIFMDARMSVQWLFGPHQAGVRFGVDSWNVAAKESSLTGTDGALAVNYGLRF